MDKHNNRTAQAIRELADHIEAGRVVDYDIRCVYGVREKAGAPWRQFENDGTQVITITVRAPTTLSISVGAPQVERPKLTSG